MQFFLSLLKDNRKWCFTAALLYNIFNLITTYTSWQADIETLF